MSPDTVLLIAYSEIALKGKKRGFMERALASSIRRWHERRGLEVRLQHEGGRLVVEGAFSAEVARVPGVHHVARAFALEKAPPEELVEAIAEVVKAEPPVAVRVKRGDKRYPLTSVELAAKVGEALGLPVDLKSPRTAIFVEIRKRVYVYTSRDVREGVGGLPYGVEGEVGVSYRDPLKGLLASALLARRGARVFPHEPYPGLEALAEALPEPLIIKRSPPPVAGRDLFPGEPCVPQRTLSKVKLMLGGEGVEGIDRFGCPRAG
ncbi:THUMP domain protein [Ignicoccus hospitalis KIN4/I]|uniref:THUMP domain protein n=2 Tax=Ignicoccus TaxID=54258 RepID=A8AAY2_IGNH4|nr:THUMP domain protein [Ignicoccus hospitalis KIN4/I]